MAILSSTLPWKIPWTEELLRPWGHYKSDTTERLHFHSPLGFPGSSDSKVSARSVGDPCSIPRSGRSPGEGNGYPLQYSCLENSMNGGAW